MGPEFEKTEKPVASYRLKSVPDGIALEVPVYRFTDGTYIAYAKINGQDYTGKCAPGDSADDHPGYAVEDIVNQIAQIDGSHEWQVEYD